jgi:hypothetical protein
MTYNGRRGPNVSEYIANLNAIPSAQELSAQDNLTFEDDLALFTNTHFYDFDLGQNADLQQTFGASNNTTTTTSDNNNNHSDDLDLKPLEFGQGKLLPNFYIYHCAMHARLFEAGTTMVDPF